MIGKSDSEEHDMCQEMLRRRRMLVPIPSDLAPFGALVKLDSGRLAEIIGWLDVDPEDSDIAADQRVAFVSVVEGIIPGQVDAPLKPTPFLALVPEDEVTLIREQERPRLVLEHFKRRIQ